MKQIITALTLILLSSAAWAEEFIIKDIRVEGLQRISAGTVFNYLPVKIGDELTENDVRGIIRSCLNQNTLMMCRSNVMKAY